MRGRDLTTGAIPAHTWALAWPVMLSIFFQTLYQAVDAFWVSQLADEALAAVNMSQIALFASVSLTIGITVGSGVLMAMSIGARNIDEAERILGQSFVLNFIAAVVLTTLVLALRTPILRAVGATDAIFPLARDYLTITGSAMVLIFLFFAAVFGFNSQGDNTTVTMLFAISTGLNIVLDPLLIFGWLGFPRLGVRGAAIATVISQVVLLVSGITLLATRDMMVRFRFRRLVIRADSVAQVLSIGFPASLTSMMGPLAMGVLTAMVSRAFGDQGAVAVSVGLRAEVFSFLPAIGFGVAGLALIGQNMGAGNPDRARRSYRTALVFALSFGTGLGILAVAFAGPIARTFTDDPVVIGYATRYLRSVPLTYGVMGAGMVVIMSFQGLRRSWRGAAISALRLAVLSGAAILLASLLGAPIGAVWLSVILANLVYAGVGYLALERQLARPVQPHGPPRPPEPDPERDPAAAHGSRRVSCRRAEGETMSKRYTVRAERCDHRASADEIYRTLERITEPLTRSWERLERARRIVIKFNMMHPDTARLHGRRQELVDEEVMRAVLRLLRARTNATLIAADTCVHTASKTVPSNFESAEVLREFGVEIVDASQPPLRLYDVPGGGNMFDRYLLTSCIGESDEFVSVAKMKNHLFMGVTLCMKNLFGLPPPNRPEGRVRHYFHHAIRLSYVLPDLAMITDPCLNIVDGLVGQQGSEWSGRPVVPDALIAGDQTTATDACAAHLMGHDPAGDWPAPPFRRDRNHLLVAAERGYGTVDLDKIDFQTDLQPPLAEFDSDVQDPPPIVASIRRTACEQGLFYRDERERLVGRYAGEMVVLRDREVVWHGTDQPAFESHGHFAGGADPGSASFMKVVDPEEREGEAFGVYERLLPGLVA